MCIKVSEDLCLVEALGFISRSVLQNAFPSPILTPFFILVCSSWPRECAVPASESVELIKLMCVRVAWKNKMVEGPPASGIILSEGPPPDALVCFKVV